MSTPENAATPRLPLDGKLGEHVDGLAVDVSGEDAVDRRLAEIEMAGEEAALGFAAASHTPLSPDVRYLHISRTIHQLVTDRNRSVGIYLAVASLLYTASTALLHADPAVNANLMVPLELLQRWCLPVTFGTLSVIGAFVSMILIRSRVGLIYEVAKMNVLLGLPTVRVGRVNPLSIFYLMHLLVGLLGGASAGFAIGMLAYGYRATTGVSIALGLAITLAYVASLEAIYHLTIRTAMSETKLSGVKT
jgi:hypothetical protein